MPIKSYLAYPVRGRREELTRALGRLRGCQVFPAVDRDLLVVVTDTPDEAADEALQRALADVPALDALALVAGVGEAAIESEQPTAGAQESDAP
ncbi:MAG TPA: hypothetical protein VF653_07020 [Methylomirabilota bacterium]